MKKSKNITLGDDFVRIGNKLIQLAPVNSSGTYFCEYGNCDATQTDKDNKDILFYGDNNGMYCKKHIIKYLK